MTVLACTRRDRRPWRLRPCRQKPRARFYGRLGERVRVDTVKQRAVDAVSPSVMTDRQDMSLVEGAIEGGSAMA